jgi:chloride channel protein, CIC family
LNSASGIEPLIGGKSHSEGRKERGSFFARLKLNDNSFIIILSVIVGLLAGYGAIAVSKLINLVTILATQAQIVGGHPQISSSLANLPEWWIILLPMVGGLIVGPLIYYFSRESKGHGVPEVMEAVALRGGKIRPRVAFIKAITSAITIGTGGSVGREGPMVQIGASIGSTVTQWMRMPAETVRLLVGAGASAGIAAAFNAPVAGVFFSIEVIIGHYAISTLSPLVLSSVVATVVSRHYLGDAPSFTVPAYQMLSSVEVPLFAILGLLSALTALALIIGVSRAEDFFDRLRIPEQLKPALGGLIIGLLLLVSPYVFGMGFEAVHSLLHHKMAITAVLILLVTKVVATSVTLGSGGSGGIFSPCLVLGASIGNLYGGLLQRIMPYEIAPAGAYALVGMAAVVAGAIHAPITSIVMIFEMTGDYSMILPLMLGCVISSQFASFLKRDSIYTEKLARRGIKLERGFDLSVMEATNVGTIMRHDVTPIPLNADFRRVLDSLLYGPMDQHYVLDEMGRLRGLITIDDIKHVLNEPDLQGLVIASDLMRATPPFLSPGNSLAEAMRKFSRHKGIEELPVVENDETLKMIGTINRRDIFLFYDHEILRRGTLAKALVQLDRSSGKEQMIKLPAGGGAKEIPVTSNMVKKTLRELDIRARFNVNVVAIRRKGSGFDRSEAVPEPNRPLAASDLLLIIGAEDDIVRMMTEFDPDKK